MNNNPRYAVEKLAWMRDHQIWPNGLRYLWTDAYGVILLVSLFDEFRKKSYLDQAERVVANVDQVLGRSRGIRIGEAPDRDGQYFHYLTMWLHALEVLGRHIPEYRRKGVDLVRQIHEPFLVRGEGVIWKMQEDLSAPYPGFGFGALDAFGGYVAYNMLDRMWFANGYYCREPEMSQTKFAFTNYGVSIGLQAVAERSDHVQRIHKFFETYRSGDEYDDAAITHVMACNAHFPGKLLISDAYSPTRTRGGD